MPHPLDTAAIPVQRIQLSPQQESCLRFVQRCRDRGDWGCVIEGYAGTGKTTTIAELVRQWTAQGEYIGVCAPTNKAVRVLMQKIQVYDDTVIYASLHSFLGMRLNNKEYGKTECEPSEDAKISQVNVLIVDEASMVNTKMYDLLRKECAQTFVIFVGDPYQLPPVNNSGNAISPCFAQEPKKRTFILDQIVRQAEDNPVINLSMNIRRAEENGERFDKESIIRFIEHHPDPRIVIVDSIVPYLKAHPTFRAIAWRNSRVQQINSQTHKAIYGETETPFVPGESLIAHTGFTGWVNLVAASQKKPQKFVTSEDLQTVRVMDGKNPEWPMIDAWMVRFRLLNQTTEYYAYIPKDYAGFHKRLKKQWYDIYHKAKSRHIKASERRAFIQKIYGEASPEVLKEQETELMFGAQRWAIYHHNWSLQGAFAEIRHAYASTAHKSQGSTWDGVVVDLNDLCQMPSTSAYNRALYVAVTRTSDILGIVL